MSAQAHAPILLLGPTASGKSALAMRLAEEIDLEIISVDSAQIYRGLDIGTAKPNADELARVPHHLIDIREPDEPYSAASFVADARQAIAAIQARGRRPLLVGGTMLYARALIAPLDDLPPADPALRRRLDEEAGHEGWPALHRRLAGLDPVTAARLKPTDAQRIQRALEVIELTGRPLSELQSLAREREGGFSAAAAGPAAPLAVIAIQPGDRSVLHRRIAERFDAMLAAGLVAEVRQLLARPGIHADLPALRAVGYRQVAQMLAAQVNPGADGDAEAKTQTKAVAEAGMLRERGIAATRQLAKRQLTWLRSLPLTASFDCLAPDLADQVLKTLAATSAKDRPLPWADPARGTGQPTM